MTDERDMRIVVGVDGSDPSKAALRWALRQAKLTHTRVDAVTAWEFPSSYYGWVPEAATDTEAMNDHAREILAKAVTDVVGDGADVEVRQVVARGDPSNVLIDAADGAEMLVVGTRGHGAFMGALLGSVSNRCVHHATCPVVVVRESGE